MSKPFSPVLLIKKAVSYLTALVKTGAGGYDNEPLSAISFQTSHASINANNLTRNPGGLVGEQISGHTRNILR